VAGIQLSSSGPIVVPVTRNLPTEYEGQRLINATSSNLISSSTKHYTYGTGYWTCKQPMFANANTL